MKINTLIDSGNIYFMSDLHYNHANVLKMDDRGFSDIGAMNSYIENTLQNTLKPGDVLFDLGDLFWSCEVNVCKKVLSKIKVSKFYKIIGNHDKPGLYFNQAPLLNYFTGGIYDTLEFCIIGKDGKKYSIQASHYPIIDYFGMYRGGLHLFGHTHGHIDKWVNNTPRLMVDLGYNGELAKNLGTFIIPFQSILDHFYNKTGGLDFNTWIRQNDQNFY